MLSDQRSSFEAKSKGIRIWLKTEEEANESDYQADFNKIII